jgi:K+-sensing histidine kinase KdpD
MLSGARAMQKRCVRAKLKSALLDAVTHDLRTPLASIKASITTLLDEVKTRNDSERVVALDAESRVEMMEVIDEESIALIGSLAVLSTLLGSRQENSNSAESGGLLRK